MQINKILWSVLMMSVLVLFTACEEDVIQTGPQLTGDPGNVQFFTLSEGSWNGNNSTLAFCDFTKTTKTIKSDIFLEVNNRGLGDMANDMAIYGSKLYIVVNGSNTVEVIDVHSKALVKQIPMVNEEGEGRSPRKVAFADGKAYISSFDGTVVKIDTTTLAIEDWVLCGSNPEGLCVANGKLYVSNSGGLNYPDYDNTVTVIDLASFEAIKTITVDTNPGRILADSEGDVYVATLGNYDDVFSKLHRISSVTDELIESFEDIQLVDFSIYQDKAYLYNFGSSVQVFDCLSETLIQEDFLQGTNDIQAINGLSINPANGDIYLTDAKDYTIFGALYGYDKNGNLKFNINEIGLNPKVVVFVD